MGRKEKELPGKTIIIHLIHIIPLLFIVVVYNLTVNRKRKSKGSNKEYK